MKIALTGSEDPAALANLREGLEIAKVAPVRPERPLAQTVDWLRTVLRDCPPDAAKRLRALPKAASGWDAIVGSWGGLDIVVTAPRIHVIARAPADACRIFRIEREPAWTQTTFAGLALRYQQHEFERSWEQTLHSFSDGERVKFTMQKYRDRTSDWQVGGRFPHPEPWF